VKRLALLFAIFWWAQGPLCLLPLVHAQGSASSDAAAQHHHAAAPATPESGHQHDPGADDSSCAEHCASLARALSPATPQASEPASLWALPAASLFLGEIPRLASPSGVARERPPLDLLLRNATLRI